MLPKSEEFSRVNPPFVEQVRENSNEKNFALNFDDNRLTGFTAEDCEKLYEAFYELFASQKTWYFDEIQNIKGWE